MKNMKLFILLSALFFSSAVLAQKQKEYLAPAKAPQQITAFVKNHFPGADIVSIKKKTKLFKKEYEVKLDNRAELEFDGNFAILDIESKSALPNSVLPLAVRNYAAKNYPNAYIKGWEKKRNGQKIELSNDLDLYFDANGNFLKADD